MNAANILYQNIEAGRGSKVAVLCRDKAWTYQELVDLTGSVGNGLSCLGIDRENRVALLMVDAPELMAAFYGTMSIGAVPTLLNTTLLPADYELLVNQSRAKAIFVSANLFHLIEPVLRHCPGLRHVICVAVQLTPVEVSPDEPAFWLYSSGSTGRPKAVVHLHRAIPYICEHFGQQILGLRETDVCFSSAKLYHSYGLDNSLCYPIFSGASIVLWDRPPFPTAMFELIERFHVTVFFSTPVLFVGMMALSETQRDYDLRWLRFCVSAGEVLPASTFERWKERYGLEILDGIGCTEMVVSFISNALGHCVPGSSGKVVPGYRVKIADEAGLPVPVGQVGDLWVSGRSSAKEYWLDRDRTQRTMRGEWVVTGDKYRQDHGGYFWYVGRCDDVVKINGVWVSPLELESILKQHPAVAECAVVVVPDVNELPQVKAYVVLTSDVKPSTQLSLQLRNFVRERSPQHYPRMFDFVESLPRTATGKIKRYQLRELTR
jgi:benzoate-CoA ligase family protein